MAASEVNSQLPTKLGSHADSTEPNFERTTGLHSLLDSRQVPTVFVAANVLEWHRFKRSVIQSRSDPNFEVSVGERRPEMYIDDNSLFVHLEPGFHS